jgi:hypothetical protein
LEIFFLGERKQAEGPVGFDLFGDPIPEGFGGRGRPPHVVTDEKRRKVMLLLAVGKTEDEVAAGIGITAKTLRKHYSRLLRVRDEARARLEAGMLDAVAIKAADGSVSAIKELDRLLEKYDRVRLSRTINQRSGEKPEKIAPLGKKEMQRQAALEVSGKFAPPPAPNLIN